MGLREIRKNRRLSQRELADMSGVNFRSLQDYEQGHKKLSSASGDVLLRLTTVLGCSAEELIAGDSFAGAAVCPQNSLSPLRIQEERFYCAPYRTAGRWICANETVCILLYYHGKPVTIPFSAIFTDESLPWLREAAAMQMEAKLDELSWMEGDAAE